MGDLFSFAFPSGIIVIGAVAFFFARRQSRAFDEAVAAAKIKDPNLGHLPHVH